MSERGECVPARDERAPGDKGALSAPYSDQWETKPLDWALDRIARKVKDARDAGFAATDKAGRRLNALKSIGTLGGATLDVEENYLMKKLFSAGLGVVSIENQARI